MQVRTEQGLTVSNGWAAALDNVDALPQVQVDAGAKNRSGRATNTIARGGWHQDRRVRRLATESHRHHHTHADAGVGLSAGHTTVVPDLPFCTVLRGPLLFALPLETSSVHGNLPHGEGQQQLQYDDKETQAQKNASPECVLQSSLGCFREGDGENRQLQFKAYQGEALTRGKCALACAYWCGANPPHNHNCLAGVEGRGNQCYCGHHIADKGAVLPPSRCNHTCSGNAGELCGGDWAVDIFNITCAHPLPPDPFAPPVPPPPPQPPVREWRYALQCDAKAMQVHERPPISPFDWPLNSAITVSAQAMPFRNWSSIWSLPSQPLEAHELGITDDNAAIDAVSLSPLWCCQGLQSTNSRCFRL